MGYYSYLFLDEYVLIDQKHCDPPGLDTLFREADFQGRTADDDPAEEVLWNSLEADVDLVRFRLNIAGYTIQRARELYDNWRAVISNLPSEPEYYQPGLLSAEFYERHGFDEYVEQLTSLLASDRFSPPPDQEYLQSGEGGYIFQFPHEDPLVAMSVAIHCMNCERLNAQLPVTDSSQRLQLRQGHSLVVLTEGKADANRLERAFKLIAPQYAKELRFLDHEFRPPTGTGEVVRLLKSLAAVGLAAPLLALFDNDTAGHLSLQEARKLNLPGNFILATYPNIELAHRYPTLGPSGLEHLDINGSACSLELYLGADVLLQSNAFSPIRWTGYEDKLRRYQGVVSGKTQILDAFDRKLSASEQDGILSGDWSGINAILRQIVASSCGLSLRL